MHRLDYTVFLNTMSQYFEIRKLKDYAISANSKVCLLRHDVDHDINRAIKMAEIEYSVGIQSSYYVLHTAAYYQGPGFISKCHCLQEMGHEVGLHNNILTACMRDPYVTPEDVLVRELSFLRDNGIAVTGSTSHGDPLCHDLNYINYQIFDACIGYLGAKIEKMPDNVGDIDFYKIHMADYGLAYEGVFIKRGSYLSDSGGAWVWEYPKIGDPVKQPLENQDVIAHINNIGKIEEHFVLQVLAHPIWWPI